MAVTVRFVICLHSHQPVGNLDHVFEAIYRESYAPFLDVFADHPEIPLSLHYSGPLFEWLDQHHPEYLDRVAAMAASGQAEIMGGAFYEPILALLPSRDRIDQVRRMDRYIRERFGVQKAGFWLAERVWEQALVADMADAGVDFTLVDHTHFNYGGFEGVPSGYFTAEDRGRTIDIFPINEKLRYMIPFSEPDEIVDYLATFQNRSVNEAVVVYADDGEKFGSWPGTTKRVYTEKWLDRFLTVLAANRDWLQVTTFTEARDALTSSGLAYLPDASYREMMGWVLNPGQQERLEALYGELEDDPSRAIFVRGGSYRNFRRKYPESFHMYARMLDLSRRVTTETGRKHLHMAQCNCAYWHGVFGGIYLPHLRGAVYEQLIRGEQQEPAEPAMASRDLDMDGKPEWILNNDAMKLIVDPDRGGRLISWDLKSVGTNFQATFSRQPEAYHRYVREGAGGNDMQGVHDTPSLKEPDLEQHLVYDRYQRLSLVDHVFDTMPGIEDLAAGLPETSLAVVNRPMGAAVEQDILKLTDPRFHVNKTIQLDDDTIRLIYETGKPDHSFLAIEWNLFALSADAPDKGFFQDGTFIGNAGVRAELDGRELTFRDAYRQFAIRFQLDRDARFILAPVYTINLSESGIEKVFQNASLLMVVPMPVESPLTIHVQCQQTRH